jgi:fatty aldehyde-generating acyl-ACP reductase
MYRKYPGLKWIPKNIILFVMNHLWPITVSRITGLTSHISKKELPGYVLGITMTAEQMMTQRPRALKKIRQALYLARGRGATIIGLGGLTSSLSKGGLDLVDIDINITTGHAYTAYNIYKNIIRMREIFEIPENDISIAVVGAAGSVGSTTSQLIARHNYKSIVLIDIERKKEKIIELEREIRVINKNIVVEISHTIADITRCDFVVTATNTSEALVTKNLVHDGMVIIDDAQPSDIDTEVLKMPNVLVLEAGVVHTPDIKSNFNYGLKSRTDNFCCMAELLILASHEWRNHYVIHRATLADVDKISEMGDAMGFRIAEFQNFLESVSYDKIENVKQLALKKHALQL